MIKKIKNILHYRKWDSLSKGGKANIIVNRVLFPTDVSEHANIEFGTLNISTEEIKQALQFHDFNKYDLDGYPHTKIVEYLSTIRALNVKDGDTILDAAGGANCEYLYFLKELTGKNINLIGQDAFEHNSDEACLRYIAGSVDEFSLEDNSISGISCHHSFEHFRHDIDISFIKESLRVLQPGGRLVIAPLFIANRYTEIWNNQKTESFDSNALQLYDETATFCGWGPYEGFARVYDNNALVDRIIVPFSNEAKFTVLKVKYNQDSFPDMTRIDYQPSVNADMKILVIEKTDSSL